MSEFMNVTITLNQAEALIALVDWAGQMFDVDILREAADHIEAEARAQFPHLYEDRPDEQGEQPDYPEVMFLDDRPEPGRPPYDYYDTHEAMLRERGLNDDPGDYYRQAASNADGSPLF